jgi:Spy/CpxP family protein refolding chaperone
MGDNPYRPQFREETSGCGLNLTAEQTRKLEDLQESFLEGTNQQRKELKVKQNELRTLWDERNPDQNKILTKQKEINALEPQLQEKVRWYRLEAQKFLAPQPRAQLETFPRGYESYELRYGMRGGLRRCFTFFQAPTYPPTHKE